MPWECEHRRRWSFLKKKGGDPFFLTVSYFDPHPPYMAPSTYTSRYASRDMKLPETVRPGEVSPRLQAHAEAMEFDKQSDADLTETMRYYHAAIEYGVDAQVGRLLRALTEQGLDSSTLVIFTADHGDFMGHYRMVRKGMLLYDHLLHVPLLVRYPGVAAAGRRVHDAVQLLDLFPTIAEATGSKAPEGVELRGRSFLPLLSNPPHPAGANRGIFASAGYAQVDKAKIAKDEKQRALHQRVLDTVMHAEHRAATIRTGEWRMTLHEADPPELFQLGKETGERKNVVNERAHAKVRRELEGRLQQWWRW
ncbi:MAG: sulfatase-like hydrolase/transferase [Bryobacteraceae bacterium]